MRLRLPNEIVSSVLAATTAFIGGNALNLPVWGIFIGWAATFLAGGPHRATLVKLWPTMAAGSTFALVIVLLDTAWKPASGQLAQDAVLAAVILVVNTALMYAGRTRVLALIPGMFLGFASYFATMFGGFGFAPQNPWAAWVSVLAMNALGPVFALVAHTLAARRAEPGEGEAAETSTAAAQEPA
ncbi:MAG: hypothetical protein QOE59_3578 [Actinomycetota bacterium]|jgi:hypothetical protein|nr:hypothetical protein [Actinomycetota bacterium]